MSFDLFGNPVEEPAQDNSAEIKRNLEDAKAFWQRMAMTHGNDSVIAQRAKEGYYQMKREAGL